MTRPPSRHEQHVYDVIGSLLGASVGLHDDGSHPRMHDAMITYPDQRQAALEVTRVIHPNELKLESITDKTIALAGAYDWVLWYPMTVQIGEIRRLGPALVALCEAANVDDPTALTNRFAPTSLPQELLWYIGHRANLVRIGPNATGRGELYVSPQGFGGAITPDLRSLGAWVKAQSSEPWFVDNCAKLAASGLKEQHLAVTLHVSAVPGELLMSFMRADSIDTSEELAAGQLTDLWLLAPLAGKVARWTAGSGWSLHDWP